VALFLPPETVIGLDRDGERAGMTMATTTVGRVAGVTATATLGAAVGAVGGWLGLSRFLVNHHVPLPPAIDAERRQFVGLGAGPLSYYAAREAIGRPLVLLHSINAAASAYEMRPLFEAYRAQRPVYALDFPGYGFSARGDRAYTPALFAAAVEDLLQTQVPEDEPVDVVALSLGCEFAARAALEVGGRIRSLALVSPTGLGHRRDADSPEQHAARQRASERRLRAFSLPLWSQPFYDLLTTRASVRYYLRRSFVDQPDPGLVDYDYATSHQPGARFAPLAFISGQLFSPDIRGAVYERLTQPVLVLHDEDAYTSFEKLPTLLKGRANWQAARIAPTRGLPQFEQREQTTAALDRFWAEADRAA
jgi:pimeloyl-ACP methyl ester carboxylesterase